MLFIKNNRMKTGVNFKEGRSIRGVIEYKWIQHYIFEFEFNNNQIMFEFVQLIIEFEFVFEFVPLVFDNVWYFFEFKKFD
jgi:hypothetical protein